MQRIKELIQEVIEFGHKYKKQIFYIGIAIGVITRLALSLLPYNFDIESYGIVADIVDRGGNVYAETSRYNYGPVWFTTLGGLFQIAELTPNSIWTLRYLVAGLLTLVDVGILLILTKKHGKKVGLLFFLNPISILITGYHGQFDNIAILLAMLGIWIFGEKVEKKVTGKKLLGLMTLGLSLMTKHIFFIFPLWLAIKQKGWKMKLLCVLVPLGIFAVSFLPFISTGLDGILHNVFMYKSFDNGPFWYALAPTIITRFIPKMVLFIVTLVILAFVFRKKNSFKSLLAYTIAIVIFSPAIANQYLAIAIPFVAVNFNALFALFTLLSTLFLTVDVSGLSQYWLKDYLPESLIGYNAQIVVLTLGFVFVYFRKQIVEGIKKMYSWVKGEMVTQIRDL